MRFGCGVTFKFKRAKLTALNLKRAAKPNTARTPPKTDSAEPIYDLLFRSACVLEGVFNRERLPPFAYSGRFICVAAKSVGAWIFDVIG